MRLWKREPRTVLSKDMEDLVNRLGTKVMSRKVLEVLSTIGAFDSIDPNRRMWLENVPQIYRSAQENEEKCRIRWVYSGKKVLR